MICGGIYTYPEHTPYTRSVRTVVWEVHSDLILSRNHLLDVCCELSSDNVTVMKMEEGLPVGDIRITN